MTSFRSRTNARLAALLLMGVLIGAALAVAVTLGRGARYTAAATAYLDPATSPYSYNSGDPAVQVAAVDAFSSAITGAMGLAKIASQLGVSEGDVLAEADIERLGVTNDVRVVYTATTASRAEAGAKLVASAGLSGYNAASHDIVARRVAAYQKVYASRSDDLLNYIRSTGEPAPDVAYGAVLNQITNVSLVSPQTTATGRQLRALEARRDRLARVLPRYRDLGAAQQRAGNTLQTAEGQATSLQAAQEAATAGVGVDVGRATRADTPKRAATNGVLGGLAGLLIVALLAGAMRAVRPEKEPGAAPNPQAGRKGDEVSTDDVGQSAPSVVVTTANESAPLSTERPLMHAPAPTVEASEPLGAVVSEEDDNYGGQTSSAASALDPEASRSAPP